MIRWSVGYCLAVVAGIQYSIAEAAMKRKPEQDGSYVPELEDERGLRILLALMCLHLYNRQRKEMS
ncbi:hypothetical protein CHL67_03070 [Prosthecochloris sp. GSB1]|nr:hypothetical protein CHL67_03070 [Prosthecochloris sp. GSB1]